tara:strand:- start:2660 stop:3052 length:393 start_codon:yes stop_codon:yes gene_type:complete
MFIIDGIINFVSVAPDSYAPLKHISAMNLIFWLAMSLFILENSVVMIFQYALQGMENITKFFPIDLDAGVNTFISETFVSSGFPLKFAQLIKPFSPFLYAVAVTIITVYGLFVSLLNLVLSFFTKKRLDL